MLCHRPLLWRMLRHRFAGFIGDGVFLLQVGFLGRRLGCQGWVCPSPFHTFSMVCMFCCDLDCIVFLI